MDEKEQARRRKISQSMIGNTRRLGYKSSEESKSKQSESLKGKRAWNKGKQVSDVVLKKMKLVRKGIPAPWMKRPRSNNTKHKLCISIKNAWKDPSKRKRMLDRCRWKNTSADNGQLELLKKWNNLGFRFSVNHQVKTDVDLFYIDGYDPIHNVVLEYDSKYHSKEPQKSKDLIRQNKIINILKPKRFWRYNAVNKQFRDVLKG